MGEAITSAFDIGAQKIHDNNTNTNNLDFIFFHYPSQTTLEPTQPTSPTPTENKLRTLLQEQEALVRE
jgi:hypothetical protein